MKSSLTSNDRTPFADWRSRFLAGKLGVWLFLASLAMLFGATLLGFLVIRLQLGRLDLWPRDLPALPSALWLSTFILALSSATMQWALTSARTDRQWALRLGMILTLWLGAAFLANQALAWIAWLQPIADRWHDSEPFRYALTSFYLLTGIHAAHVIGGLIPMVVVTLRSMRGTYGPEQHGGVHFVTMYWHFLGAVWIVLFGTLLIGV